MPLCVYDDGFAPCPLDATHRAIRTWEDPQWFPSEGGDTQARAFQVPEFCAAHAAEVCCKRNTPRPTTQGTKGTRHG